MKRIKEISIRWVWGGIICCGAAFFGLRYAATTPLFREVLFNNFHTDHFSRIAAGMTQAEVRVILNCEPHDVDATNKKNGVIVWEYHDGISPDSYYVTFTNDMVSGTYVDN